MKKTNSKKKSTPPSASKQIAIFVPAGNCILSSIIGTYKIFTEVNKTLHRQNPGKPLPFNIQLVGINNETNLYEGAFNIKPHTIIERVEKTNMLISHAIFGELATEVKNNEEVIPWSIKN